MIRRTAVVLDTPAQDHIHLFSVFEDILPDMQDAQTRDRHARAHHYKLTTGQGDIQIHIENLQNVLLADVESHLEDYLVANGDSLKRLNEKYVKEPTGEGVWMILDAAMESRSTIKNILPTRRGTRNVRAYIDAERKTLEFIKQDEKIISHLGEVTEKMLGFNLTCYSEHIGNIYLVETTSPVKDIDVTGIIDPKGLLCAIEYRDATWHEAFNIQVRDRHHSDVIVWDMVYEIAGGTKTAILEMPQVAKDVEVYAYDKAHNIIYYHHYTPIVRSINIEIGVQSKILRVKGRSKEGKDTVDDYPKFAHEKPIIIAEGGKTYVDGSFSEAKPLVMSDGDDKGLIFRFFDTDENHQEEYVEAARQVLQEIIDRARTECYICDPYFNADDFQRFIYPLKSLNVNVKILNCREQMKKKWEGDEKEKDRILELKSVLAEYNEKMSGRHIQCKLLLGRGQLHDRFILTDDRGWVLGSSFSEFGNRVTTINEIPAKHLARIKNHIEKWWYDNNATMWIENYVAKNSNGDDTDNSTGNDE